MKVCIALPCYNEAAAVDDVIAGIRKIWKTTNYEYEIVLVDDKSTDASAEIARKARVFIISHLMNLGAGAATQTALYYAKKKHFDFLIAMDADGQHDPEDALKCLNAAIKNKTDLTIGSRLINHKGMSTIKVLGNKGLTFFTYMLFGVKVTDSQSGLRVFSKKAINHLSWKSTGYDFCSEMLYRAKKQHLKISEYPIQAIYTEHSRAKGQNNWNGINIVKSLLTQRILEAIDG